VGDSSVLDCHLKNGVTMVTWKFSPLIGAPCTLGYRPDTNTTNRTTCSDNMNWKSRPDLDASLEIWHVGIAQEGNYTCEVVSVDGSFHKEYYLTVLVPPRPSLYCDDHGSPVCEAAVGKPPARVWWVLESNSTPEKEGHDNGTVTVLSRFTARSTNVTNTTCMVFHPTGNWSQSIAC
ncbi:MOR1B protein, partial [Smithornis capensis]|nr:MOR1B protein [Smithornis capensis]